MSINPTLRPDLAPAQMLTTTSSEENIVNKTKIENPKCHKKKIEQQPTSFYHFKNVKVVGMKMIPPNLQAFLSSAAHLS